MESISADLENRDFLDEQRVLEKKLKALARMYNGSHLVTQKLYEGIRLVRKVRNKIAHEGGRVDDELERMVDNIAGLHIEHSRGMLRIDEVFCEYALKVVEKYVYVLTQIDYGA